MAFRFFFFFFFVLLVEHSSFLLLIGWRLIFKGRNSSRVAVAEITTSCTTTTSRTNCLIESSFFFMVSEVSVSVDHTWVWTTVMHINRKPNILWSLGQLSSVWTHFYQLLMVVKKLALWSFFEYFMKRVAFKSILYLCLPSSQQHTIEGNKF